MNNEGEGKGFRLEDFEDEKYKGTTELNRDGRKFADGKKKSREI